jgi:hypothetical protein
MKLNMNKVITRTKALCIPVDLKTPERASAFVLKNPKNNAESSLLAASKRGPENVKKNHFFKTNDACSRRKYGTHGQ